MLIISHPQEWCQATECSTRGCHTLLIVTAADIQFEIVGDPLEPDTRYFVVCPECGNTTTISSVPQAVALASRAKKQTQLSLPL